MLWNLNFAPSMTCISTKFVWPQLPEWALFYPCNANSIQPRLFPSLLWNFSKPFIIEGCNIRAIYMRKIRRVLDKTQTFRINGTFRVKWVASYFKRNVPFIRKVCVLSKTRLIFPHINGPNVYHPFFFFPRSSSGQHKETLFFSSLWSWSEYPNTELVTFKRRQSHI